jgi:DNA-directed RNA polymerase specialized sigma24 family protein
MTMQIKSRVGLVYSYDVVISQDDRMQTATLECSECGETENVTLHYLNARQHKPSAVRPCSGCRRKKFEAIVAAPPRRISESQAEELLDVARKTVRRTVSFSERYVDDVAQEAVLKVLMRSEKETDNMFGLVTTIAHHLAIKAVYYTPESRAQHISTVKNEEGEETDVFEVNAFPVRDSEAVEKKAELFDTLLSEEDKEFLHRYRQHSAVRTPANTQRWNVLCEKLRAAYTAWDDQRIL